MKYIVQFGVLGCLDVLFSSAACYRRLVGGRWYRIWELPFVQGGFTIWTRNLCPGIPGRLEAFEDYTFGTFIYGLSVPKNQLEGWNVLPGGWLETIEKGQQNDGGADNPRP